MNVEEIRLYCLSKPEVEECFPFGVETLVFKTGGKIFLLVSLDAQPVQFNAKCDPDRAAELREQYDNIRPGYHMNKKHWNTITAGGALSNKLLRELIDHSYELVYRPAKKKTK